jgi:hypothetical protein
MVLLTSAVGYMDISRQIRGAAALHRGKSPLCSLDRIMGGSQSRSGQSCEEKIPVPVGNRTRDTQRITLLKCLSWLKTNSMVEIIDLMTEQ